MQQHHLDSIRNLIDVLQQDPTMQALILSGSLAKGNDRPDSDIDVYIVVTDEEFARRRKTNDTSYLNEAVCTYPGGYVDGKIIDRHFIEKAAVQASEPTRASFLGARVLWSRVEGLEPLVARIGVYDDARRDEKMLSFYAQVQLWGGYFYKEGLHADDPYLTRRSLTELVFYTSRYILAKNRILFPCHKTMLQFVEKAPDKPEGYLAAARQLLAQDDPQAVAAFMRSFNDWAGRPLDDDRCLARFIEDSEWNWLSYPPPLADC